MKITKDIIYVGVDDHKVDLFEGQYIVPEGMAYNSYLIADEKTAVTDTVAEGFGEEWIGNIKAALGGKAPDYLIVHHMEPDHSANIDLFMTEFPEATIVSSAKAFTMMGNFLNNTYADRQIVVNEGDTLELGAHSLAFIAAPMVHWPEVMLSYDKTDKVLFSADAFGKFGANDVYDGDWDCEARRYYFGIVGKFGAQVQNLLKKAAALDIQIICPLHGPVLTENTGAYIATYDKWSSYTPEDEGVVIAYTSVYGHTKAAAEMLAARLEEKNCPSVSLFDLARDDMAEAVEDAFRYDRLVLATTTYNGDIFPYMREFINHLTERNYQKRRIAVIENGSWAAQAEKVIKKMLENSKDLAFAENTVHIKSALNDESKAQIEALAEEFA